MARLPLPDTPTALEEANHHSVGSERVHELEPAKQGQALCDLQHGRARRALRAQQLANSQSQVDGVVGPLEAHVVAHLHERVERRRRGGIARQPQVPESCFHVGYTARGQGAQRVESPHTDGPVRRRQVRPQLRERTRALTHELGRVGDRGRRNRCHAHGIRWGSLGLMGLRGLLGHDPRRQAEHHPQEEGSPQRAERGAWSLRGGVG